jgi:hypothetical protein
LIEALDEARCHDQKLLLPGFEDLTRRIGALRDHFDIELDERGGWVFDLALVLAKKYEPELMNENAISRVFREYGIEPAEHDPILLVLKIAERHIPGFACQFDKTERRPGVAAMADLYVADTVVSGKLKERGEDASVRTVANILIDDDRLKEYVSETLARAIREVLDTSGNASRENPEPLSPRALRYYIGWMRDAPEAYFRDEPNSFQIQFMEQVMPLFLGSGPDEPGGQVKATEIGE